MSQLHGVVAVLEAIVGVVAAIALLVGGVGVMNMMLVSVSERVREIGIRKALGASPREISMQFLMESALLSSSGGAAGVAGGMGLAVAVNLAIQHFKPSWVSTISIPAVLLALGVSLLVGVSFGFLPARKAGRLEPVVAMRQ